MVRYIVLPQAEVDRGLLEDATRRGPFYFPGYTVKYNCQDQAGLRMHYGVSLVANFHPPFFRSCKSSKQSSVIYIPTASRLNDVTDENNLIMGVPSVRSVELLSRIRLPPGEFSQSWRNKDGKGARRMKYFGKAIQPDRDARLNLLLTPARHIWPENSLRISYLYQYMQWCW